MLKIIFSRNFFLQRQNLQNQAIFELYDDDNKSKYSCNSEDKIYKIKQHLNYMLTIINQNIRAILRIFLNIQKKIMKNFTPKRQLPMLLLLNFLAKFVTDGKYLMNNLNFVRRNYL